MDFCALETAPDWAMLRERISGSKSDLGRQQIQSVVAACESRLLNARNFDPETNRTRYAQRLWNCICYHWRMQADLDELDCEQLVHRLENGNLHYGKVDTNILSDIVLAMGMELGEARALQTYELELSPIVEVVARRVGGRRAVEKVENFAVELVIPRGERPPRISTYGGRTPLTSWLRSVVVNHLTSEARKIKGNLVPSIAEPISREVPSEHSQRNDCARLLEPLFQVVAAGLESEDRLLLQMLVLDEVPQKDVARMLGVNSGTITRRRQRATTTLFSTLQELAADNRQTEDVDDCLQQALAGRDVELQRQLSMLLAVAIRTEESPSAEDGQR